MKILLGTLFLFSLKSAFAIPCDCHVISKPPLTGSITEELKTLKILEVEEYGRYSKTNFKLCQNSCLREFQEKYLGSNLNQDLRDYTADLLAQGKISASCSSVIDFKYPIEVKAKFGDKKLGLVEKVIEFVHYEASCF